VAGFDPLLQFVEEDDVIRSLEHVTHDRIPGVFNVAGAGKVPWSEVVSACGAAILPLPPLCTRLAAAPLVRLRLIAFPAELDSLLRFGRGVDTASLEGTGFTFRYTTAGVVDSFVRSLRLRRSTALAAAPYTYHHDVEQFFRRSPAVVHPPADG
jgi:UDP-glucose 4-epimerase